MAPGRRLAGLRGARRRALARRLRVAAASRHTLAYTLWLDAAGVFGLPPLRVEAMHAPENFAELPLSPLEVRP